MLISSLIRHYVLTPSRTWNAVVKLADELREKKVKIGFFSSTPQGGKHTIPNPLDASDVEVLY